jgi:hypothetical protein
MSLSQVLRSSEVLQRNKPPGEISELTRDVMTYLWDNYIQYAYCNISRPSNLRDIRRQAF